MKVNSTTLIVFVILCLSSGLISNNLQEPATTVIASTASPLNLYDKGAEPIVTTTTTLAPTTTSTTVAPAPRRLPRVTTTTRQAPPVTSPPTSAASAMVESKRTGRNWDAVAQCESGGRWNLNTGNGYYGGLQFLTSTWLNAGGGRFAQRADLATREQQIEIADTLATSHWPRCGRYA